MKKRKLYKLSSLNVTEVSQVPKGANGIDGYEVIKEESNDIIKKEDFLEYYDYLVSEELWCAFCYAMSSTISSIKWTNMPKEEKLSEMARIFEIFLNDVMGNPLMKSAHEEVQSILNKTTPKQEEVENQEKTMENKDMISKLQKGLNDLLNLFKTEKEEAEQEETVAEEVVAEEAPEAEKEESPEVESENVEPEAKEEPEAEEEAPVEKTEEESVEKEVEESAEIKKENIEKEISVLKEQIEQLKKEKEEQAEKAEKENVLSLVKKELAFVVGTIEENADKLFELKKAVSEDQYAWIVKNLKKQSEHVEKALEESGVEAPEAEDMTAHQKLEKIAKGYQEVEKELTFEQAYRKAQDFNPDLASLAIKGE